MRNVPFFIMSFFVGVLAYLSHNNYASYLRLIFAGVVACIFLSFLKFVLYKPVRRWSIRTFSKDYKYNKPITKLKKKE